MLSSSSRVRLSQFKTKVSQAASLLFSGKRQRVLTAVFIALTLTVIGSVLYSNRELLRTYEWNIQPQWLIVAIAIMLGSMVLGAWAWHRLVSDVVGVKNGRLNIKIWWYTNLAKRLPGVVWYIASRAVLYEQAGVSKRTTTLMSGLELALMFISGIITTLLTLPFWALPSEIRENLSYAWFLLLLIPLSLLLIHPRILEKVWQKLSANKIATTADESSPWQVNLTWKHTVTWLAIYISIWIFGGLILFSTINFFQTMGWQQLVAVIGMWTLANTVSLAGAITFTNIGVREVSLTLLLTQMMPFPVAIITIITIRLILLAGALITAVVSLKVAPDI